MNKEKVVIIIPTYNEEKVIGETIRQVFAATVDVPNFTVEILIFDSASTDSTQAEVKRLMPLYPRLRLHTEAQKSGLGSAYIQAMRYALTELQADIVVEFDADLSHQPKYLSSMLEKLNQADAVVGSRYIKGGSIPANWGWHRKLLSVFGNYVARCILTMKFRDFTSGFRAIRRSTLEKILPNRFLSLHYAYKLHLMWLLHKNKAKVIEFPIEFIDRTLGESKLPANSIKDALRVIFTLRAYELQDYLKMCLVGLTGAGLQLIVYNLLRLHCPPLYAIKISTVLAIINNFILNHRFTFKRPHVSKRTNLRRLGIFTGYYLAMIQVQAYSLALGINYLGEGRITESLLLVAIIGVSSILNYFVSSRFIWRKLSIAE